MQSSMDLWEIFGADSHSNLDSPRKQEKKKKEMISNDDQCSICWERMKVDDTVLTPCGHVFHKHCFKQAYFAIEHCPLCRQHLPNQWLLQNDIFIMTNTEYWLHVEHNILPPPPEIGPLLPSQQRHYNVEIGEIEYVPQWWTRPWIADRLIELRMRFNIPPSVELTAADLRQCAHNGIRGIEPEWTAPTWVHY